MPGETLNLYNFQQNISIFMILVSSRVFMYARDSGAARKDIRHCIIDNINMAAIYLRSNDKLIQHSTE